MYTVRIPLELNDSEKHYFSKCFHYINTIHNTLVRNVNQHMRVLLSDQEYLNTRKEYESCGFADRKSDQLSDVQLRKKKRLSFIMYQKIRQNKLLLDDMEQFVLVMQKKYAAYISRTQALTEAKAVYQGFRRVLDGNGTQVHFRRFNDTDCIRQKGTSDAVRIFDWTKVTFMGHTYRLKQYTDSKYMNFVMRRTSLPHDVINCSLKRMEFNSGFRYYVILLLNGNAPRKRRPNAIRSRTGIDLGTSTIATASNAEVNLEELAPKSPEYEKQIRHLQNLVNHSMRVHNPDNYNDNGTIRKGKHKWTLTRKCRKRKRQIRVLFRKQSAYIKTVHNTIANRLIRTTSEFIIEPMSYSPLQRKEKKTELSDETTKVTRKDGSTIEVRKFKRKKRYGKSIRIRAPGYLQTRIRDKASQYDIPYYEINIASYRASSFHHDTGEYIKSPLNERTKVIHGHQVQRDLYSAFLICNTDDTLLHPDLKACSRSFAHFLELHDEKIAEMKRNGISRKSCFGF
ncbi:MAG: hypothetical protein ACI32N_06260 [Bulleidia sp.]